MVLCVFRIQELPVLQGPEMNMPEIKKGKIWIYGHISEWKFRTVKENKWEKVNLFKSDSPSRKILGQNICVFWGGGGVGQCIIAM